MWAGFEETPIYAEKFQLQDEEDEKKTPAFKLNVTVHNNVIGNDEGNKNDPTKDIEDNNLDEFFE